MEATESIIAAEAAGLAYVADNTPGIRRKRAGKGFSYALPNGTIVRDSETLERIKSLGIPPAWRDVWICTSSDGHIQATGRDLRGRKQYRYHPRWREVRDAAKYDRMLAFGQALPLIRERVTKDLALAGLPREKVLATVVRLLEITHIRIGNDEYARTNKSFGLTTMRDQHVRVKGTSIRFKFRGKSGKEHAISLSDKRLAKIVQRCQELPGHELFQYLDEQGQRQDINSGHVNAYLREITGQEFTAKDFRTWAGSVLAAQALDSAGPPESPPKARKRVAQAIKQVAHQLGNTPAICRKCYVHPSVIESYLDSTLREGLQRALPTVSDSKYSLQPEEAALIGLLGAHPAATDAECEREVGDA